MGFVLFQASKLLKRFDKSLPKWLRSRLEESTTVLNRNEPFEILCVCGLATTVVRFERYQQIICLDCGEAMFVLPKNPYPEPPPTDADRLVTSPKPSRVDDNVDEENEPLQPESAQEESLQPLPRTQNERTQAEPESTTAAKTPAVPTDQIALGKIKRPSAKLLTPFRLMLLGIGVVLFGTGYFVIRSQQQDRAEVILHEASEAGLLAIEENRIDDALLEFEQAASAADTLGMDKEYTRFHRLARQCDVIGRLSDASFYGNIDRAEDVYTSGGTTWLDELRTQLKGEWFIFDASVYRRGDSFAVIVPVLFGTAQAELTVKSEEFSVLNLSGESRRVIFAGKCDSFRRDNATNRWIVGLQEDSTLLWTSQALYEHAIAELTDDPWDHQTIEVLRIQKQLAQGED